jgi:hypothetical protein
LAGIGHFPLPVGDLESPPHAEIVDWQDIWPPEVQSDSMVKIKIGHWCEGQSDPVHITAKNGLAGFDGATRHEESGCNIGPRTTIQNAPVKAVFRTSESKAPKGGRQQGLPSDPELQETNAPKGGGNYDSAMEADVQQILLSRAENCDRALRDRIPQGTMPGARLWAARRAF